MNSNVKLNFSSALEGAVLILTCENKNLRSYTDATDEQILTVTCNSNTISWIPDPTDFIESCSSVTTLLPGIILSTHILEFTVFSIIRACGVQVYAQSGHNNNYST